MRIAHVILVDKNPVQILRLLKRIYHRDADIYIHIDLRCPLVDYHEVMHFKNVRMIQPRGDLGGAGFSRVETMINAMRMVMHAGKEYDYVNFMSGEDYPLQAPAHFLDYLQQHKEFEFIGSQSCEGSEPAISDGGPFDFSAPARSVWLRVMGLLSPGEAVPDNYIIRRGSPWMVLTGLAVLYILKFVAGDPGFVRYFKRVEAPCEFFFQTILYNSPFRSRMRNDHFHYGEGAENGVTLKTLTIKDKEQLLASDRLFARKFDMAVDSSILDVLDGRMLSYSLIK